MFDVLLEDAPVAEIAVRLLAVHVELDEVLLLRDVPVVGALRLVGAGPAVHGAERALAAIVPQAARGRDFHGVGVEPPVDEVEVVGGLVHPQRAALLAQAVPAAEVIGPVGCVEVPREVDGGDGADLAGAEDLLDLLVLGRVAVVEGHDDLPVVPLLRVEHGLALRLVRDHRLLGHDVDAAVESLHDAVHVVGVDRGHAQQVGLRLVQHLLEAREGRTGNADLLPGRFHPQGIDVGEADELEDVPVALYEGPPPHPHAPHARAHDGVAAAGRGGRARLARDQGRHGRPSRHRDELPPSDAVLRRHGHLRGPAAEPLA